MEIVPLSAFADNYIWALVVEDRCVVVDPGDAAPVQNFLAERRLQLTAVLVTHRHNDHVGGVPELREAWDVPVFGPPSIAVVTRPVKHGDRIDLPGVGQSGCVIEVPGHTEEHIAFIVEGHLFCGDTLFVGGCGRLLGASTAAELYASLQRIAALPPETLIHCAHEYTLSNLRFAQAVEPANHALQTLVDRCRALREQGLPTVPSRLADELATNPFMRTQEATVREAAERHIGRNLRDPAEVFAVLRAWKDDFR